MSERIRIVASKRPILCNALARYLLISLYTLALAVTPQFLRGQVPPAEQLQSELTGMYSTRPPRVADQHRGPIARRIEPLMIQQSKYLLSALHPWKGDSEILLLTDGNSGEHGIRPNGRLVQGLATMAVLLPEWEDGLTSQTCIDKATAVLRFVLPRHGAGGEKCSNGKQWNSQWQSALWAYSAGKGAWLIWDHLTPEQQWLAARMICDEADRFVDQPPPAQIERDTKAEENAWNSLLISLAYNMFPKHPHHDKWGETAYRWAISSFARKDDLTSSALYNGKPLKDWLTGANIHDDYALENHDRVHPDYMSTINQIVTQWPMYAWGGNPVPDGYDLNIGGVYAILKKLSFPDGGVVYPNGQDWQIHRNPIWFCNHMEMSIDRADGEAARLMLNSLEAIERMASRRKDFGVYLPEEYFFQSTQMDMLTYLTDCYIYLRQHGEGVEPISEDALWQRLSGLHIFETGKFGLLRTSKSVSTFSWGRQVMGMCMPLQDELLLTPNERSMIGAVHLPDQRRETPRLLKTKRMDLPDVLAVAGILDRGAGALEQRFGFAALPDGRTVYVDAIDALTSAGRAAQLQLGMLTFLNEPNWIYGDGQRTLHFAKDGVPAEETFISMKSTTAPLNMSSNWINVDDQLGIVSLQKGAKQTYTPTDQWTRGRLEQPLVLNEIQPQNARGDLPAVRGRTALVFYPGQKHLETAARAEACAAEWTSASEVTARLEDGTRVRFDLHALNISIAGPEDE